MSDDMRSKHEAEINAAVAQYGHHFVESGLFGKPNFTVGVQSFGLDIDVRGEEDAKVVIEFYRRMFCFALSKVVEEHTSEMKAALQFYADVVGACTGEDGGKHRKALIADKGAKARAALGDR